MMRSTKLLFGGLLALCAATGYFGYLAFINHYAYEQALAQLRTVFLALGTRGSTLYGTVQSVGQAGDYLVLEGPDPYQNDMRPSSWRIALTPQTLILYQATNRENGIVISLSSTTAVTLAAVQPGVRARAFFGWQSGEIVARVLIVGDPI